jgi:hypothetical protein
MLLADDTGRLFAVNGLKNSRAAAAGVCEIARASQTQPRLSAEGG